MSREISILDFIALKGVESPIVYYHRTGTFDAHKYNELADEHFKKDTLLGFVLSFGAYVPHLIIPATVVASKKLGDGIYDAIQLFRTRNGRIPRSVRRETRRN